MVAKSELKLDVPAIAEVLEVRNNRHGHLGTWIKSVFHIYIMILTETKKEISILNWNTCIKLTSEFPLSNWRPKKPSMVL